MLNWLNRVFVKSRGKRAVSSSKPARRRVDRLQLESLEDRLLMTLTPTPWVEQGPIGFTFDGLSSKYIGPLTSVALVKGQKDILFVGSPGGGIWRTTNANSNNPDWTPIADNAPTENIRDIKVDPSDASGNTLYAGTRDGFVLRVNNALGQTPTFDTLGFVVFANQSIEKVIPTGLDSGKVLINAGTLGVFTSLDRGATWNAANGIPTNKEATDLFADADNVNRAANQQRFYAALPTVGVFRSDDSGATWTATSNNQLNNVSGGLQGVGQTTRILLASHNSTGKNVVYAALFFNNQLTSVYRSENQGGAWTAMAPVQDANGNGVSPGSQGNRHGAIIAHPTNPNVIFVGGDAGPQLRGDATVADSKQQWKRFATDSYVDARLYLFDEDTRLLKVDDGGVYRLAQFDSTTDLGKYQSLNATLRVGEMYTAAWDSLNDVAMGSLQDTGTWRQTTPGNPAGLAITSGDGITVRIDSTSTPGRSYAYFHTQTNLDFTRQVYDASNQVIESGLMALTVAGTNQKLAPGGAFTKKLVLNEADPRRLLIFDRIPRDPVDIGGAKLFESLDRGDTVTPVALPFGFNGSIQAVAYGGRRNGVVEGNVLYVGTESAAKATILLRGPNDTTFKDLTTYPGNFQINAIAVDPDDWMRVYAAGAGKVFRSLNAGDTWEEITGDLATLSSTVSSIAIYGRDATKTGDEVVFAGGSASATTPGGGVFGIDYSDANPKWIQFAMGLPRAVVADVAYNAADNLLIASTDNRGIWTATGISGAAGNQSPVLDLNGAAAGSDFAATVNPGGEVNVIDAQATIADVDSTELVSATIANFTVRDGDAETLDATVTGNIQKSFQNGILTLSGKDTKENYQAVLRTVKYKNTAAAPTPIPRVLRVTINDGTSNSNTPLSTITVTANSNAPLVDLNGSAAGLDHRMGYSTDTVGNPAVLIVTNQVIVTAGPGATINGALIRNSNPVNPNTETLDVDLTGVTGITKSYDAPTGRLTLTGNAPASAYQQVLRTVKYRDTTLGPRSVTRVVEFTVTNSNNVTSPKAIGRVLTEVVNTAPMVDPNANFRLTAIAKNAANNQGNTGFDVLDSGGRDAFFDPDPAQSSGFAIISAETANGNWEFSTNGGTNWQALGSPTDAKARFLFAQADNKIRFVPKADFEGTASFRFRGWDATDRDNLASGFEGDTSSTGGTAALSTQIGTARITVGSPAQLAPSITSANNVTFTVGTAGTFTVTATGTPKPTLSVTGNLPGGISFDAGTGVLSGTPAAGSAGDYALTFKASNGVNPDATQTFTLSVTGGGGGGGPAGTIAFASNPIGVNEGQTASITINRTGGSQGTVSVTYTVTTASTLRLKNQATISGAGADFTGALTGTITFAAGETTAKTLTFPIGTDNLVEVTESFVVTLSAPTGGAALGSLSGTTVNIADINLPVVPNEAANLERLKLAGEGFGKSEEHYKDFVSKAYARFLSRLPDSAGFTYWVTLMQRYETSNHKEGLRQEQIEAGFIDSPEYKGRYGGAAGEAWVRGIYNDLLGRTADQAGVDFWLAQLANGVSPTNVALGFTASDERLRNRVNDTYRTLLERESDAPGLAYWIAIFKNGGTTEDINSGFVGSPEYYAKANSAASNPAKWIRDAYLDILFRPARVDELDFWFKFLKG